MNNVADDVRPGIELNKLVAEKLGWKDLIVGTRVPDGKRELTGLAPRHYNRTVVPDYSRSLEAAFDAAEFMKLFEQHDGGLNCCLFGGHELGWAVSKMKNVKLGDELALGTSIPHAICKAIAGFFQYYVSREPKAKTQY
jgi:hypothetical protein